MQKSRNLPGKEGNEIYKNLIKNICHLFSKKSYQKRNGIKIDLIESIFIKKLKEIIYKQTVSFKTIINLIAKPKFEKSKFDIKVISEFLSEKYDFFKKLKESNQITTLHQLVSVLNLEHFKKDEFIIKFNDVGTKFYILLEGTIGVYKPKLVPAQLYVREFVLYLSELKKKDTLALERVERKNAFMYDMDKIKFHKYDYLKLPDHFIKKNFYIEENILLVELHEGAGFGEMALLQNAKRNASIISHNDTILASIEKEDYDQIIRVIERAKLNAKLDDLQQNFLIFKSWDKYLISKFMNYFTLIKMNKGDTLYHQNDISDSIYLIMNGNLEITTKINIGNFEKIKSYMISKSEILFDWLRENEKKEINLKVLKEKLEEFQNFVGEYPFTEEKVEYKRIPETTNKLLEAKFREMEIKNPKKTIKLKVRNVNFKDCLGIEEAFECKRRYSTVQCISPSAEVNKIKMIDLIDFFRRKDISFKEIEMIIKERKEMLINLLKNNLNVENRNLDRLVELQYNTLLITNNSYKKIFDNINESNQLTKRKVKQLNNLTLTTSNLKIRTYPRNFSGMLLNKISEKNNFHLLPPKKHKNKQSRNQKDCINTYFSSPNIFSKTSAINFTNGNTSQNNQSNKKKLPNIEKIMKMGEKYRLQKLNNYISKLKTKGREYLNKEVVNIIGLNKKKHQKSSSLPNIITEELEDKLIKAHNTSRGYSDDKEFKRKLYFSNKRGGKGINICLINIPLTIKMKYFRKPHFFKPKSTL